MVQQRRAGDSLWPDDELFRGGFYPGRTNQYHGGLLRFSRATLQLFLPQRSGKMLNMVGRGYKGPVPYQNAYGASKAWVLSFTKSLAQEYADSGVGIFNFSPG